MELITRSARHRHIDNYSLSEGLLFLGPYSCTVSKVDNRDPAPGQLRQGSADARK